MLTRDKFQKLNEADLRQNVLLPLLRSMGFNYVHEYHGGSGELGKDIVCWKQDELGSRINYAVVAKATKMSGKAQPATGTAGEVQTQIRQCFGSSYIDSVTSQEQWVSFVWVISNKKISKEAINAIKSGVADDKLMRNVRFINGDTLWELVEEYLPIGIGQLIEDIRNHITTFDSHYEPHITIAGNQTSLTLKEKFPGASEQKPIKFNTKFLFDDQTEAISFQKAFQHHIETGKPLSVPHTINGKLELPEFLNSLIGMNDIELQAIEVLPSSGQSFGLPVRIELLPRDGDPFVLNYVLLKRKYAGTKELTLTNEEQELLFFVELVVRLESRDGSLTIRTRDLQFNAVQYLEVLKLSACLSGNLKLRVTLLDTEIVMFEMDKNGELVEGPSSHVIDLFTKLATVQKKIGIPFIVPERDLTLEEVKSIHRLFEIVTTGQLNGDWESAKIAIQPSKDALDTLISTFGNNKEGMLALENEYAETLFDTQIPLGPVRRVMHMAKLQNIDEVENRYDELLTGDATIELTFIPGQENIATENYLDWQSKLTPTG